MKTSLKSDKPIRSFHFQRGMRKRRTGFRFSAEGLLVRHQKVEPVELGTLLPLSLFGEFLNNVFIECLF